MLEPGVVVVGGGVWEPVHPASAIAPQRIISTEIFILSCIPENASRGYIMFLFAPGHHTILSGNGGIFAIYSICL
jgi:hypothetical protein